MKRYTPYTETDDLIMKLQLSQIEAKRGYLNSHGFNNSPNCESPFNPIIYSDVRYSEPSLSKTNRCMAKYENGQPSTTDIALYDTRSHDVECMDVPEMADNVMLKNQLERARSKIEQANADMIPSFGITYDENGYLKNPNATLNISTDMYYNPYLPISDTNKPPSNMKPTIIDERMLYHTNDRPWNYPSDKGNIAYNLQRSQEILERNRRQEEADDALFRRPKINRWVEPKMAYNLRPHDPKYTIDTAVKDMSDKNNERLTLSPIHAEEKFSSARIGFDADDINHLNKEINGTYQPLYNRQLSDNYEIESLKYRMEQFKPDETNGVKGVFVNVTSYITDTIKSFFDWNNNGTKTTAYKHINDVNYDVDGKITYDDRHNNIPIPIDVNSKYEQPVERYYYKPNHVLIVKNGDIPEIYPDENYDYTAVSYVQADPLNTGLIRTIVMQDNSKLKIIQKHKSDAIFTGDNKPYGEDFICLEIPVEAIDEKFRERLNLYSDNKRSKFVELKYDDFLALSDYMLKHPEVQQRLKFEDLYRNVRANKYDVDIVNNFEGKRTFVDDKVYSVIQEGIRRRDIKCDLARIDKDQININETFSNFNPIHSSNKPSNTSQSYRKVQLNDKLYSTKRSQQIHLNKFNV